MASVKEIKQLTARDLAFGIGRKGIMELSLTLILLEYLFFFSCL